MANNTTILITGCARGIGRAMAAAYLLRPFHTVIAAVRDPNSAQARTLADLATGASSSLILIKIDSASETDAAAAVDTLTSQHDITRLDLVVANAGISNYFGAARVTPASEVIEHYRVNVLGPLLLFQATAPLLLQQQQRAANGMPKFVAISSGAGSIDGVERLRVENTAYGASKAALNFVVRRIHAENEGIVAFPLNPGWLQTELGNHAATSSGMEAAPMSVEEGVRKAMEIIDNATREGTSGRFMSTQGGELPW